MSENLIFIDTNIMLDYIEKRHKKSKKILDKMIKLNKNGKIKLSTSIFNIAELLDVEFEINYFIDCINNKMSADEISTSA